jgi:hypothetical protein
MPANDLAPKTVELTEGGLLRGSERSPHEQLLFNLILNGPKPLFGDFERVSCERLLWSPRNAQS